MSSDCLDSNCAVCEVGLPNSCTACRANHYLHRSKGEQYCVAPMENCRRFDQTAQCSKCELRYLLVAVDNRKFCVLDDGFFFNYYLIAFGIFCGLLGCLVIFFCIKNRPKRSKRQRELSLKKNALSRGQTYVENILQNQDLPPEILKSKIDVMPASDFEKKARLNESLGPRDFDLQSDPANEDGSNLQHHMASDLGSMHPDQLPEPTPLLPHGHNPANLHPSPKMSPRKVKFGNSLQPK